MPSATGRDEPIKHASVSTISRRGSETRQRQDLIERRYFYSFAVSFVKSEYHYLNDAFVTIILEEIS